MTSSFEGEQWGDFHDVESGGSGSVKEHPPSACTCSGGRCPSQLLRRTLTSFIILEQLLGRSVRLMVVVLTWLQSSSQEPNRNQICLNVTVLAAKHPLQQPC